MLGRTLDLEVASSRDFGEGKSSIMQNQLSLELELYLPVHLASLS
jgi:hypothetical protein